MLRDVLTGGEPESGFTLSEMLIVLAAFLIIVSVSANLFPRFVLKLEIRHFIQQLGDDLYYAEQYAISHEQYISILIKNNVQPSHSSYQLISADGTQISSREIPDGILIEKGTAALRIFITNTGSFTSSGTWYVRKGSDVYKVTFYLGKGRFKIEEV
ncbi:competence type IV pilus minor pilin ComGD [Peribacillus sp. SCS-155]|uniref:competence type IV pilus minor pilin ComGD n=1 Tax=Peribacillus sedimenti TaxID=3115297 RepID=UPI0039067E65